MFFHVFQEAEGISRDAKLWWCKVKGHTVHNLQHDGIVARPAKGSTQKQVEASFTRVCSHALGYMQPVAAK